MILCLYFHSIFHYFAEESRLVESNGFGNDSIKDENSDLKYEPTDYWENGTGDEDEKEREEGGEVEGTEELQREDEGEPQRLRAPHPMIRCFGCPPVYRSEYHIFPPIAWNSAPTCSRIRYFLGGRVAPVAPVFSPWHRCFRRGTGVFAVAPVFSPWRR